MQATSGGSLQARQRPGIAIIVIVTVLIVVVVVAGAAAYYLVVVTSSTSTSGGQSSSQTSGSSTRTSTITTYSVSTSTGTSPVKTYSGTFKFTQPLGPFGELTFSNNDTVKSYTSVQAGSGSFNFSINLSTYEGTGSGQGTLTVTTTGFCSGRTILPYTFQIPDATNILGGNITVFIGNPTPANFTVPLTCTAQPNQGSSNGDTFPFLSIFPNEITIVAAPVTVNQNLTGGVSYQYTITPTN